MKRHPLLADYSPGKRYFFVTLPVAFRKYVVCMLLHYNWAKISILCRHIERVVQYCQIVTGKIRSIGRVESTCTIWQMKRVRWTRTIGDRWRRTVVWCCLDIEDCLFLLYLPVRFSKLYESSWPALFQDGRVESTRTSGERWRGVVHADKDCSFYLLTNMPTMNFRAYYCSVSHMSVHKQVY